MSPSPCLFAAGTRQAVALASVLGLNAAPLVGQADVRAPTSDKQLRTELSVSFSAAPRFDIVVGGQLQAGQRAGRIVQNRIGAAVQWKATRHLTLTSGYQHLTAYPLPGGSVREDRPTAAASLRVPVGAGFTLSDRNQVDLRLREGTHYVRYRNRITLERAVESREAGARLFVSDEVFYDLRDWAWLRNQVTIGAGRALTRGVAGELYLMHRSSGRSLRGDLIALGATLRVRIR